MLQNMQNKGKKSVDVNTHFTLLRNAKRVYSQILLQNLLTSPLPGFNNSANELATD